MSHAKEGAGPGGRRPRTMLERVMRKIHKDSSGCWAWMGATTVRGVGVVVDHPPDGKVRAVYVPRFLYENHIGPLDHRARLIPTCGTARCVNPAHLSPSRSTRGVVVGPGLCRYGHDMTENPIAVKGGGTRCRVCHNEYQRDRQRKVMAELRAYREAAKS